MDTTWTRRSIIVTGLLAALLGAGCAGNQAALRREQAQRVAANGGDGEQAAAVPGAEEPQGG